MLCWWAVCWGVWLTLQASLTLQDAAVGAAASGGAALLAGFGRRAAGGGWRWRLPWWHWMLGALVAIPAETVRVLWRVYRHPGSTGHEQWLDLPPDDQAPVASGRRAFASMALAASPAAYVVDLEGQVEQDGGENAGHETEHVGAGESLRVHRLVPATPAGAQVDPALGAGSATVAGAASGTGCSP